MFELNDVQNFTKTELFDTDRIIDIFDCDKAMQLQYVAFLSMRAGQLHCKTAFDAYIKGLENEYGSKSEKSGKRITNIDDFVQTMRSDIYFANLRYNEFTKMPETMDDKQPGKMRVWTDFDDSAAKSYLETNYNLRGEKKYFDAMNILMTERAYNPIRSIIEAVKWDGKNRIDTLLIKWLKCEDTPYTRELSRLIFAGGIHRAYEPGCKFDDTVVLVGKQGCGKSTFIRWLAITDELYSEVTTIEGKEAKENLLGIWIGELGELLAVTKLKECEAVKQFLTCKCDRFRPSYARRTDNFPRQCIFIGSTNKLQFLTDKTGNRRMYPAQVECSGQFIYANKDKIQEDIRQCWAEALAKKDTPYMKPAANSELIDVIRDRQRQYMEEDYREGMISAYLEDKKKVCIAELWVRALNCDLTKMTRKDSNDLVLIMQSMEGWERGPVARFSGYGRQVSWLRKPGLIAVPDDEDNPF